MRVKAPNRRRCETYKCKHGKQKMFVTVGFYEDGRPYEIFVNTAKAGSDLNVLLYMFGITASIAIQCGADVKLLIALWRDTAQDSHFRSIADALEQACAIEAVPLPHVAEMFA